MACEPSPSPIDVDTKAIVQQVVDVLLKHSPSPAVHLEVLGRRADVRGCLLKSTHPKKADLSKYDRSTISVASKCKQLCLRWQE
jgi:hypothetical protein